MYFRWEKKKKPHLKNKHIVWRKKEKYFGFITIALKTLNKMGCNGDTVNSFWRRTAENWEAVPDTGKWNWNQYCLTKLKYSMQLFKRFIINTARWEKTQMVQYVYGASIMWKLKGFYWLMFFLKTHWNVQTGHSVTDLYILYVTRILAATLKRECYFHLQDVHIIADTKSVDIF